jgi:hypothetical protein
MSTPLFPQRSWPGLQSWLITVLGSVAIFEFLAILAWRNEEGRLLDFTTAVVAIPAGAVLLLILAAFIWTLLGKIQFLAALGWGVRLIPFTWAIPLFDLIRTYGNGLVIGPPKLNGLNVIVSSLTAGMLPIESGISIGIRLGIFAAVIGVGIVTWTLSNKIWKAVLGSVIFSAVTIKLLSTMSILSVLRNVFAAESWTALPFELSRRATMVMSNGYWWRNLYERFPTAIDAQAEVAARLVESAFVLFTLGLLLGIVLIVLLNKRWSVLKHIFYAWGTFDLALYSVLGIALAVTQVSYKTGGVTIMLAIGLFLLLLIALRFTSVIRRDLSRLEVDERNHVSQPILRGDITVEGAKAMALSGELYVLFVAWILGWPVFACTLVYLSASNLTRSKIWSGNAWAAIIFRALGAGAIALLAMFFVTQDADITTIALTIVIIASLHRLFIEGLWLPKMRKG